MKTTTLAGTLLCLSLARAGVADVTYEQETKMTGVMKVLTLGKAAKTVTYIGGDKMRTESDRDVHIVDVGAEKIYALDTKKKTYTVTTFEEMRKRIESGLASVKEGKKGEGGGDYAARADVKVSETGKTSSIQGFACKQYLMELDLKVENKQSGEQGDLSTLTELWLTGDAPGVSEIHSFYRKMAEKLGTTEIGRQMLSGEGQSNEFAEGMRRMGNEMRKMNGFAMRSVFYFGSPEAAREEAMKSAGAAPESTEKEKKGGGLGGFLKKIPGAPGGQEPGQTEESKGRVITKIIVDTKRIESKPVDATLFTVPPDYKQVEAAKK